MLCFSASKQQYVCCILFVWIFFFTIRIFIVLDGFISSKETNLSYSYIPEHDIEYEDWNMLYKSSIPRCFEWFSEEKTGYTLVHVL